MIAHLLLSLSWNRLCMHAWLFTTFLPPPVNTDYLPRGTHSLVHYNTISGTLPNLDLSRLQQLFLFNNKLSGTLPSSLSSATNLVHLFAYSNMFIGAGTGLCANPVAHDPTGTTGCRLEENPAWTDGALCPACLNSGTCTVPNNVVCTAEE